MGPLRRIHGAVQAESLSDSRARATAGQDREHVRRVSSESCGRVEPVGHALHDRLEDAATAYDDFDTADIIRELYPDQAKSKAEGQRRFQLLTEHMDVPVTVEDPATWR
jgi:hypothetical protein